METEIPDVHLPARGVRINSSKTIQWHIFSFPCILMPLLGQSQYDSYL